MVVQWWSFNIRHLRAICAIAEHGSVSRAAGRIHLSQPALTQGIAKIERTLGLMLFERHSGGMSATEAGRLLAQRTEGAFALLSQAFVATSDPKAMGTENRVTSPQLRAFLAFADAGSFAGAAAESGIAQPTLHRAVASLEALSQLSLYRRVGRGIQLSPDGRIVARGVRRARAEIEAAISEIEQLSGREVGMIRIGAMPIARAGLIPQAVARFRHAHEAIGVEIADGTYAELVERLKDGELDFLVGALRGGHADPAVTEEPLFDDLLSVVCRPSHPLAGKAAVTSAELAAYPWSVARPDTPHHQHWRRIFLDAGLDPPANPIITGSAMAIRELLEQGDYLALLSRDQVQRPVEVGHLALLGAPLEATRRSIGLTTRTGFRATPFQREMTDLVRALAASRTSAY